MIECNNSKLSLKSTGTEGWYGIFKYFFSRSL
jgi:hypothetical protein